MLPVSLIACHSPNTSFPLHPFQCLGSSNTCAVSYELISFLPTFWHYANEEVLQSQNKQNGNNWTKSMTAEYAPLHHYCRLLYFVLLNSMWHCIHSRSWSNVISMANRLQTRWSRVWIVIRGKRFSSSPKHPDMSGSHQAFYLMGTRVLYSG
jgi:hypothetical protein